ncbi:MAG TPA: transglycosylase SLT domain-containing protein [Thiolinea sp.]|nr:transglycosylase SLT domain-containing protein [Thiolinea sp.]
MGTSSYLAPVAAVCALLFLNGCSNTKPATTLDSTRKQTASIPEALPLTQQGKQVTSYRQPKRQTYARRTWIAQARPERYESSTVAAPRVQRAVYIPAVSSSASVDPDFDTWSRVFHHFQLADYSNNPRVQQFIYSYAQNPQQLSILSDRASVFLHMIIEEVTRRGMPAEVALLPFVESGFDADVFSSAGAAGLWQFIPSTGRNYGLKQTGNYDARMDPFAATGAALNYLQKLNRQFNGDWLLAFAAYNCGETCVSRAVIQAQQAGLQPSFWNLSLPQETMNYVPRLLAFKELIGRAGAYGIRLPATPNSARLAQLRINKPVDLRLAAMQAGLPANRLLDLNPCFRTGVTTPEHSNRIILPREYADRLAQVIRVMPASYSQPSYSWGGRSSYGS